MEEAKNPLGYERLPKLLRGYAVPSIIAMVVSSLYNIVDQIFIGQGVGYLGNAATNVAFPLTTICLAIALLIGIGSASRFSLELGAGNPDKAAHAVGNAFFLMLTLGIVYCVVIELFLEPLLYVFGCTGEILPYAVEYTRIVALGMPAAGHHQRSEQPGPRRRQPQILHDVYALRRHCQHDFRPHFHLCL